MKIDLKAIEERQPGMNYQGTDLMLFSRSERDALCRLARSIKILFSADGEELLMCRKSEVIKALSAFDFGDCDEN